MLSSFPQRGASALSSKTKSQSLGGRGPAAQKQQYDWEKEIESLDQKEMELHQTQMKLIREQMHNLIGELGGLREEVSELRLQREADRVAVQAVHEETARDKEEMQNELLALIQALQEDNKGHTSRLDEVAALVGEQAYGESPELLAKFDQMHARLNGVERYGGTLDELKRSHSNLARQKEELAGNHARLQERLEGVDRAFSESFDKHSGHFQDLRSAHDKHAAAFAKHARDLEALRTDRHAQHQTLSQRLDGLERSHQETHDKFASGLSDVNTTAQAVLDRLAGVENHGGAIGNLQRSHDALAARKDELESCHASMGERVSYLEQMLGDSVEKHAKELRDLRDSHSKHKKDLDGLNGLHSKHATVDERLDYMEKLLGDSADKHSEELAELRRSHDALHGRLAAADGHGSALSDLRKSHGGLAAQKKELEAHHASLKERVDYLEQLLNDSADKHAEKVDAAHSKLADMHGRVSACERLGSQLVDLKRGHSELQDSKRSMDSEHAFMKDRLDNIETLFSDSNNRHAKELKSLKAAQDKHGGMLTKHGSQLDGFDAHREHHATLPERMAYIEQQLGDSADKHNAELAALHKKVAQEQSAREKHHGGVKDLLARESEARDAHHATLSERVDFLESMLGDTADKHAQELKSLKSSHDKLGGLLAKQGSQLDGFDAHREHHASIPERMAYLEQQLGDSADKHNAELAALHKKVAQEQSARDKHHGNVKDLLARESEARDTHHATLSERVDFLEGMLGDTADKHAQELAQVVSGHQKLQGELKSRGESHASVSDRVVRLEKGLAEAAERQSRDSKSIYAKLDSVANRFSAVKGAWSSETPRV